MSLELFKSICDWATIALILLTVFTGAGALLTGRIINARQDLSLHEFDVNLTNAKTELGRQQERAAKAEQDAADAKTTAATTSERATALERSADEAKTEQQRVQIELAKQQERAAKAEKELADLKKSIQPRRLTRDQATTLEKLLTGDPKGEIGITTIIGGGESNGLAGQIDTALKNAGWSIKGGGVTQGLYSGEGPMGFGIVVHNAATAPAYAIRVQRAFFTIGIPLAGAEDANVPENTVTIVVGHKPPITEAEPPAQELSPLPKK